MQYRRATRGNTGASSIGFMVRYVKGDLLYVRAKGIVEATNMEAEYLSLLEADHYCQEEDLREAITKIDSLCLIGTRVESVVGLS